MRSDRKDLAKSKLNDDEVLDVALFCIHEIVAPENVRLQCGRFYDGREFSEEDKQRIIRAILQVTK